MAKNLAAGSGVAVSAFDLSSDVVAEAAAAGCTAADLAGAASAELIVSSLPRSTDVLAVVEQLKSIGGVLKPGATWVDTTSGVPGVSRQISELLAEDGVKYLDAGVAGGPRGATAGNLAAMVGGDPDVLDAVRPVLANIMGKVVHIGPTGAGHAVKGVNNTLLAAHIVVAAEGLCTLVKQGVPIDNALEAINAASGRSLVTEERIPNHVLSGKFDFGFAMDLMNKDISICMSQLDDNGIAAPALRLVAAQFAAAEQTYGAKSEHMKVVAMYEEEIGAELRSPK